MKTPALIDDQELYSAQTLTRLFDTSLTTIYSWVRSGRLPSVRVNGVVRVTRAQVDQFIAQLEDEARTEGRS